jgi:uncharacterized protein YcbK (DUF882 family)
MQDKQVNHRRSFITRCASVSLVGGCASLGFSEAIVAKSRTSITKSIRCFNIHTRETLTVAFYKNEAYDDVALHQLNTLLRDHRENKTTAMDVKLFEQLWQLQQSLGKNTEFRVVSGYRTPKTNQNLRKKSDGVALKSYHMRGQAIDLSVNNASMSKLHKLALAMNAGGVGYYPKAGFIHLDTGPVRHWKQ